MEVYLPQLDELIEMIEKLDKKLDTLALAAAAPDPVAQPETPPVQRPPTKRARKAAPAATPAATVNGEDTDVEDEDGLRARCEFEVRRVQRLIGISGMRAAISRVAEGALHLDDVPAARLTAMLTTLQALG